MLDAAAAVRRGVTRLGRRLRMERTDPGQPVLQLSVLGHLLERGPLTPGQLAAAERVQPQSLTRVLVGLEGAGLVARQAHPGDGRRSLLAVTDAGREALRQDMQQRDAWLARAMAEHLTPTERDLLRLAGVLLGRLAEVDLPPTRSPAPPPPGREEGADGRNTQSVG